MQVNEPARAAFMDYVSNYDMDDIMVSSKVSHTMRVAQFCRQIAESLNLTDSDVELAW